MPLDLLLQWSALLLAVAVAFAVSATVGFVATLLLAAPRPLPGAPIEAPLRPSPQDPAPEHAAERPSIESLAPVADPVT
jgi:hypothetical protein